MQLAFVIMYKVIVQSKYLNLCFVRIVFKNMIFVSTYNKSTGKLGYFKYNHAGYTNTLENYIILYNSMYDNYLKTFYKSQKE